MSYTDPKTQPPPPANGYHWQWDGNAGSWRLYYGSTIILEGSPTYTLATKGDKNAGYTGGGVLGGPGQTGGLPSNATGIGTSLPKGNSVGFKTYPGNGGTVDLGGGSDQSWWMKLLQNAGPALISAVAGYFMNKDAKKLTPEEKQAQQLILQQLGALVPFGKSMLDKGAMGTEQSMNFFNRTAANPRQEMAPELNERAQNDRATLSSVGQMAGRGGASSDFLSRLPFMRAGETTNALFGARSDANKSRADLAQRMMGTGVQALTGTTPGASTVLNFGLNNSQQGFNQGNSSAKGIYQLVQGIVDSYGGKKNPGGSSAYSDTGFGAFS